MGCDCPSFALGQAWRPPAKCVSASLGQRDLLYKPWRLCLAHDAQGLSSLPDGVSLLSSLEQGRYLDEGSRYLARSITPEGGTRGQSKCGHHRQSEYQDDRKRGPKGYDAGKKVQGRKRHIVVDTLGLILGCVVHPADIQDRDGAKLVLEKIRSHFPRLKKIWADGGYAGKLVDWAKEAGQWVLEIVKRSDTAVGFEVLPHRWIVERTFAWLGRFRRMSKDYEALIETSEAMIRIAMIRLMTRRLARS